MIHVVGDVTLVFLSRPKLQTKEISVSSAAYFTVYQWNKFIQSSITLHASYFSKLNEDEFWQVYKGIRDSLEVVGTTTPLGI